jgi:hypothetical protein
MQGGLEQRGDVEAVGALVLGSEKIDRERGGRRGEEDLMEAAVE